MIDPMIRAALWRQFYAGILAGNTFAEGVSDAGAPDTKDVYHFAAVLAVAADAALEQYLSRFPHDAPGKEPPKEPPKEGQTP